MSQLLFQKASENLKKFWGYNEFRPGQDEVVKSVLSGNDTLVLFPTGGGKSLCYQVPATVLEGLTLVISPLVALMQDQVYQLQEKGVAATFINSTLSRNEVEQRLINARNGMYKLLYCAPERLESTLWQNMMEKLSLSLVAVDEAHCISEWGHDFRPVYRQIPRAIAPVASKVRWMALTATATPEVRKDILEALKLNQPRVIARGFNRPNLHWWINRDEQKRRRLSEILDRAQGSGLIYAATRIRCEQIAGWVKKMGWNCAAYHAGLNASEREDIQNRWIQGELPLVAATNAFGMGIDKPDCRFVVHYDLPMSIEAYYQEAGRAGRDGKESYPVLLIRESDVRNGMKTILDSWPDRARLQKIYDALCDHWSLALGSPMDELQKLDIEQVQKRSGLPRRMIKTGLDILSSEGILKLEQQEESRVGIAFKIPRQNLDRHASVLHRPAKREFIDRLSRIMGEQAHSKMVYIPVRLLCNKLQLSVRMMENGLEVLSDEGVLVYRMNRNDPMGMLSEPRSNRLYLTGNNIWKHRERLLKKFEYMAGYVQTRSCRSRYIRIYFGEKDVPEYCGKCDNCKKKRSGSVQSNLSDLETVEKLLEDHSLTFGELKRATHWNPRRLQTVLSALEREDKIGLSGPADPQYYLR